MLRLFGPLLAYAGDMTSVTHARTLVPGDVLVVLASKDAEGVVTQPARGKLGRWLADAIERLEFDGGKDATATLPAPSWSDYRTIQLVGLASSRNRVNALRYAAATATRSLSGHVVVMFPTRSAKESTAVAEGALLGALKTMTRKSGDDPATVSDITIVSIREADVASVAPGVEAVSIVRDLVTEVPNVLSPDELARRVVDLAKGTDLSVEVLDERALEKGGYGGILGIGAGSSRPPRLVIVRYSPKGATKHIALVGKGITFDTGGLSIKPANSMIGMKYDMTGAATVFAVTRALSQLKAPVAVTAWLCIAENMPSGTAIRPNDVITIRGGKTVEVTNTDAEGRVVLADGLVAASEESPDAIIDVATLTGAARVALGDRIAGVMGDSTLTTTLNQSSEAVGEETWTMPLPDYLLPIIASDVADIANAKIGNTAAGMLIGGVFLREFVGKDQDGNPIPWAHLDIAGPANNPGGPYGFIPKGATGTMVRTLIDAVQRMADAPKKSR
jgi:leucyl aminopeptidase